MAQSIKLDNDLYWDQNAIRRQVVKGDWTATTSNSAGAKLTDEITLSKGVWVLYGQTPYLNAGMMFSFRATADGDTDLNPNNVFQAFGSGYANGSAIVTVLADSTKMRITCGGSASMTYTSIDRGCIKAVKVSS